MIGAAPGDHRLDLREDFLQIGLPDVSTIDDAERQHEAARRLGENGVELLGRADQVEMQAGDGEGHGGVEIVIERELTSCPRF